MSKVIKSFQVVNVVSPPKPVEPEEKKENIDIDDIINKKLAEADKTAEEIIKSAKIEADNIVANAEKESEKVLEKTYIESKKVIEHSRDTGFKEGFNKGYDEGKKASDELILEANQIKRNYLQEKEVTLSSLEDEVVELIISICEKILNQKLLDDKESIISIVLKGIKSLNVRDSVVIRVSREDYDIVDMSKERILAMANLIDDIVIKVDNNLSKGGCIVESTSGNVDASINVQIKEMKKTILNLLNGE